MTSSEQLSQAVRDAYRALQQGDHSTARRCAQQILTIDPNFEDGWLVLAAIASPAASIGYLKHALEINPRSQRARAGMHWAIQRLRKSGVPPRPEREIVPATIPSAAFEKRRPAWWPVAAALVLVLASVFAWQFPQGLSALVNQEIPAVIALAGLAEATVTEAPTATQAEAPTQVETNTRLPVLLPTASSTAAPTLTSTPEPSVTPLPSQTPTVIPSPTATPAPTLVPTNTPEPLPSETPGEAQASQKKKKSKKKKNKQSYEYPGRPAGVNDAERWIDVDLSSQTAHAYEGDVLVRSFVVSTGTWLTPTVTGEFRVYVKYRSADMSGADYYLPNVPYIMYFYEGYGLHGTYWHNNFGTPMSHGCVNLTPDDAGWLFDFASVGTTVNVHN